jgi:hypothetical protein
VSNFTQEQLDAIEVAIASGTLEVSYSDKRIKYRSMSELLLARNLIRQALGLTDGSKRIYAEHEKGTS